MGGFNNQQTLKYSSRIIKPPVKLNNLLHILSALFPIKSSAYGEESEPPPELGLDQADAMNRSYCPTSRRPRAHIPGFYSKDWLWHPITRPSRLCTFYLSESDVVYFGGATAKEIVFSSTGKTTCCTHSNGNNI